jgi:site-specific DNA recombinase
MARPKSTRKSRSKRRPDGPSAKPTVRRAVLYARVSSRDQEREGFSIPAQQRLLQDYAAANGIEIAREFIDVETAKQAGRKSFGEMLRYLKKRGPACRILLVEKTDRLYRNIKDWVELDGKGLEIHLVKENIVLSDDSRSSEKFMHGIKVLMAKNYIDNLSEEVGKGMREKARQGMWPSCAPIGYRNVTGPEGTKIIEPDPDRAPMISMLFEWAATARFSLPDLAQMANDAGFRTKRGAKLRPRTHVHRILHNPMYTGQFNWGGEWHQGTYQPLISVELFDRVQDALKSRYNNQRHRKSHNFAFTGLVKCGECGCSMSAQLNKGKYVYYSCTKNKGPCSQKRFIREQEIEKQYCEAVRVLRFDQDVLDEMKRALRESFEDRKAFREDAIARLRARHDKLQELIEKAYIDKLEGRVEDAFFEKVHRRWRSEQTEVLRSIGEHDTADGVCIEEGIRLMEFASLLPTAFAQESAHEKGRLLKHLQSNSTWADGKLTVEFAQPFDILAEMAGPQNDEPPPGSDPEGGTYQMAERGGFEPPVSCPTHDFQSCTIDRSVTSPCRACAPLGVPERTPATAFCTPLRAPPAPPRSGG